MAGVPRLIAANWKMHGCRADLVRLGAMASHCAGLRAQGAAFDLAVLLPAPLLGRATEQAWPTEIVWGGQDCHAQTHGAFTGDVSAAMLADIGAGAVLVGHSERRSQYGERDGDIRAKALAAHQAGLLPIICVGETLGARQAGLAQRVVLRQIAGSVPEGLPAPAFVIAYEPVWAIGTGRIPSPEDIAAMHQAMADHFGQTAPRLLYGGSVNASNAAGILATPHVDGLLVGSASLKPESFNPILDAAAAA